MTGRTDTPARYFAIDGGAGAHLLAALAGRDPRLRPVFAPRHADLLIVVEPLSAQLAPAVVEVARALPHPARALLVGESRVDRFPGADLTRGEGLLPGACRVANEAVDEVCAAARAAASGPELAAPAGPTWRPDFTPLPGKGDRELATELAVLSLGPLQPFTAGPCRLLLVCDGEQVLSARVESGYARRGVDRAMVGADWRHAADLASDLDPLAPVAGRLAYVRALEQLQGRQPTMSLVASRDAALALERAQNGLWWLTRFAGTLAADQLADRARELATTLADHAARLWERPAAAWIAPRGGAPPPRPEAAAAFRGLADRCEGLLTRVERDRLLALRTRGVGVLATERLRQADVGGPILAASERGDGDARSRLLARLAAAATDLRAASERLTSGAAAVGGSAGWDAPAGQAHAAVEGPRGRLALRLVSEGEAGPAGVEWDRPSAAVLRLLPELLTGQKLADAETIVASLDLAMAEADG